MAPTDGADIDRVKKATASDSAEQSTDSATENSAEDKITEYLSAHPDFFVDHPELLATLLATMAPPTRDFGPADTSETGSSETGQIVDLQQYMLRETRARAADLEGQLSEIVGLAREGLHGHARIQAAVLEIIAAQNLNEVIEVVTQDLMTTLDLDVVIIAVEGGAAERGKVPLFSTDGVRVMPEGYIAEALGQADVILHENISGDRRLYGSAAELVRSQALIRLDVIPGEPAALLAMGVRRLNEFGPQQGTDLMSFLGEVLTLSIRARLGQLD